jgi:hypothetical protein
MENPIKQEIILHEHRPEWLVPVPIELDWRVVEDPSYAPQFATLVYSCRGRVSANEYRYVFVGLRINSLPNKSLQSDRVVCSCKPAVILETWRVCGKCGNPVHVHPAAKA